MSIIHIKKRENPYAQIDKRCLEDSRLSWRSRGILAYLLSKPDDWQVSVKDIENRGTEGREAVQAAMKELERFGYAQLQSVRSDKGTMIGKQWIVTEEPTNGFSVHRSDTTDKRVYRPTVFPTVGESVPSNNDYNSNNEGRDSESEISAAAKLETIIQTLKAEKENPPPPPTPAAPAATFGLVDPEAEIMRMRSNFRVCESLIGAGVPESEHAGLFDAFLLHVQTTEEPHYGTAKFRTHFFNWVDKRRQIMKDRMPSNGVKKSSLPASLRVL